MEKNIENEVYDFFINHFKNISNLKQNTIINPPNLLMDDGIIILDDFFKKFNIQKGYLDLNKYFNPVLNPIQLFWNFIQLKKVSEKAKKPIITIEHMIEVAKKGEWFDPIIS